MPIRSAYQRAELSAALATEDETSPARPIDFAALWGDWDAASDAKPSPAIATNVSGRIQMKSLYARAPPMIPPPTSESRSAISKIASIEPWRVRST